MTQSWIAVPIRKRNTKGGNWNWNGKWTKEIKKKKKKGAGEIIKQYI